MSFSTVAARLLARPIPQEYDAFTVVEPSRHPAEFEKLAARHNLVEIAEAWTIDPRSSEKTIGCLARSRFKRHHELSKVFEKLLGYALGVLQLDIKVAIKLFRVWC